MANAHNFYSSPPCNVAGHEDLLHYPVVLDTSENNRNKTKIFRITLNIITAVVQAESKYPSESYYMYMFKAVVGLQSEQILSLALAETLWAVRQA